MHACVVRLATIQFLKHVPMVSSVVSILAMVPVIQIHNIATTTPPSAIMVNLCVMSRTTTTFRIFPTISLATILHNLFVQTIHSVIHNILVVDDV